MNAARDTILAVGRSGRLPFPHPRLPSTVVLMAVLLMAGLYPRWAQGRVFQRWRSASAPVHALRDAGAEVSYETQVELNGRPGRLTALRLPGTLAHACRILETRFAKAAYTLPGATMATLVLTEGGREYRLIALDFEQAAGTAVLVMALDAPATDGPAGNGAGLPAYPQSEPLFDMRDKDREMGLSISQARAAPEAVHAFYEKTLAAQGWAPALPARSQGLRLYVRGPEIAGVSVESLRAGSGSRITVLYKQLRIE